MRSVLKSILISFCFYFASPINAQIDLPPSFYFSDDETKSKFSLTEYQQQIDQITQNFILMDKELWNRQIFKNAIFEFYFSKETKWDPLSFFEIKIIQKDQNDKVFFQDTFHVLETKWNNDLLIYLKTVHPHINLIYLLYNFKFNENDNITERALIKCDQKKSIKTDPALYPMVQGNWIQYKDFNAKHEPQHELLRVFTLDKKGRKIWLSSQESIRKFNDAGMIIQSRSTKSSYSIPKNAMLKNYQVFNPSFHFSGNIHSFNLIHKEYQYPSPTKNPINYSIELDRNEAGILTSKMIREFKFKNMKKVFSNGSLQEFSINPEGVVQSIAAKTFDILDNHDGKNESGRKYLEGLHVWNVKFDSSKRIILKRILKTKFEYPLINNEVHTIQLLEKLNEILYFRNESGDVYKLQLQYYDFDDDLKLSPYRKITLQVLGLIKPGIPSEIRLVIENPFDPSERHEDILIQDAKFLIEEAITGDLFFLKRDHPFDTHIESLSGDGKIIQTHHYYFDSTQDKKIYSRIVGQKISYAQ